MLAACVLLAGGVQAAEPGSRKSQSTVGTMKLVERQGVAIEEVDQKIASVQSEIATRKMERKEALTKVYKQEGASEDAVKKQAAQIEEAYKEKIDILSQDLAALGAERNQLVEHASRTILETRGQR